MHTNLKLTPVQTPRDLADFIHVPWSIQGDDPNWIPPLRLERKLHLSSANPYFEHAKWQGWIAWRNGRPVGRISAQIDELYRRQHSDNAGFFGLLEAVDDEEVFAALFEQAESWLRREGMETVKGPFNLSINQECGLLVAGYDLPPAVMMPYNPPYYVAHIEKRGYSPAKDLLAYLLDTETELPRPVRNLAAKAAREVHVRPLERKNLLREFELLRQIFNDAWSGNWGFVPFTEKEFSEIARTLSHIIRDDFVQIAEFDGEAAGMIVVIPDLNQLLGNLDGRLLPFNWVKLLWRWKTRYPDSGRVILMGVRRRHQNSLVGAAIAYLLIEALRQPIRERGLRRLELSWILEDNLRMRNIIENLGARCYKRYRIYQKSLS